MGVSAATETLKGTSSEKLKLDACLQHTVKTPMHFVSGFSSVVLFCVSFIHTTCFCLGEDKRSVGHENEDWKMKVQRLITRNCMY